MSNYVVIRGGTKSQRQTVENAVGWFIKNHLKRFRTLDIDIHLKDCKKNGIEGACLWLEDNIFELEIDKKQSLRDLVTTVIHEMIHVKQYVRKELTEKNCVQHWKGVDCGDISYMKQPWEIEAYELQDEYAAQCFLDDVL